MIIFVVAFFSFAVGTAVGHLISVLARDAQLDNEIHDLRLKWEEMGQRCECLKAQVDKVNR